MLLKRETERMLRQLFFNAWIQSFKKSTQEVFASILQVFVFSNFEKSKIWKKHLNLNKHFTVRIV